MRLLPFSLLGALFFVLLHSTASLGQTPHTFRNPGGQTFEGQVLSVKGGTAEIRRTSDGRVFRIPVTALSLEDRKYLVDWMRREKARTESGAGLPDGWARLRIHGLYGTDMIFSSGLTLGLSRTGGNLHEGDLPVGSWITISPRRTGPADREFKQTFLRFEGKPEWYLELRDGKLYRSFEANGKAELVAVVLPKENEAAFVEALRSEPLAERVSFRIQSDSGRKELERLGNPVAALFFDDELPWVEAVIGLAPQALSVHGDDELLDVLARVPSLEHVVLHESRSKPRWSFEAFQKLKALPRLNSLRIVGNGRFHSEFLTGFDRLRTLSISGSGRDRSALPLPPLASLESLSVSRLFSVSPASMAGFPRLRYVDAKGVEPSFQPPGKMVMAAWGAAGGDYETPVTKGWWSDLRYLYTEENVDYGKLPKLHSLRIVGITPDLEKISNGPELRHLHLYELQQADLEQLVTFPNLQNLESIRLFRGKIEDLSPLAALTRLRSLQIDRLSQAPKSIDLAVFPSLDHFRIFDTYEIETIAGVASHPNLVFLELMGCRDLKNLGDPAPNDRLNTVFLTGAGDLENLDALSGLTALKALHIWGCKRLSGPLELEETNNLDYLRIHDSGDLPERPER